MPTIEVSTVPQVLEQFRRDLVAGLQAQGFEPPPEAHVAGKCELALQAWVRLQHRSVPRVTRTVCESSELQQRVLDATSRESLASIRAECERGDDLTQRLTRQFYKTCRNDFLFNTFGIQHMHLGAPGDGLDATRKHPMAGSGAAILFALFGPSDVCFLDVLDHDVFDSPALTRSLVQIGLRNCPALLRPYMVSVDGSDLSFETAFRMAKAGFTTLFEVDGAFFSRGTVMDGKVSNGKRAACTSTEVIQGVNRALNMIADVVQFVAREAEMLSNSAEARTGVRPQEFKLEVVAVGPIVVLREQTTNLGFFHDGKKCGLLEPR